MVTQQAHIYFAQDTVQRLERRVRGYELRYGIKSDELIKKLDTGEMKETESISKWLQALMVLRRSPEKTRTTG
ncbi:MAG: hypothetical protein M1305_07455 [Candidatus Marsarchaeota archaeon]|nr:hypothetical protein [Candidatus Marsarchaeota archaeon]